jgi:rhodanese-related sulfurtransferase
MSGADAVQPLLPAELRARLEAGDELVLLDVREQHEFELCRIEGSLHIPLSELSLRHVELDPEREIVCVCHHGIRSANAAAALARLDFDRLYNLVGGVDRWAREVDPGMPRY